MNNVLGALLVIAIMLMGNVVAAGVFMVAHLIVGDSENVFVWLLIGAATIGSCLLFIRGALEACRGLASRLS